LDGDKQSVVTRTDYLLSNLSLPLSIPHIWESDFDEEQKILIVEIGLPDVVHIPPIKTVQLRKGSATKSLNQTEKRKIIPQIHPAIMLRIAYEIFRSDDASVFTLLVLNGWIEFDDPRTGMNTKAYTSSLVAQKEQILGLNLTKIDPSVAFTGLHGKSAGKLVELFRSNRCYLSIEKTRDLSKLETC
jgi:restriction system protein